MTRSNYNRIQSTTPKNTLTMEMSDTDSMIVTGEERPGHRVLTDDVTCLYDCSCTSTLELAVRPKRDMDADELIDNETARGAAHPKSDMVAEKSVENKNEHDAVRSKCDDEAEAVDEDAKHKQGMNKNEGAKKILEDNDDVSNEACGDWKAY